MHALVNLTVKHFAPGRTSSGIVDLFNTALVTQAMSDKLRTDKETREGNRQT